MHPPWNEGTRVIARNLGLALHRAGIDTDVLSVSTLSYLQNVDGEESRIRHIGSRISHSAMGDYWYLRPVARSINTATTRNSHHQFLHLVAAPLALGPLVARPNRRIIAHITLSEQAYLPYSERIRKALGWRFFDRWIDAYACTSEPIRQDLARQGYRAEKLHVVPPPIDVDLFHGIDRVAARGQFGLEPETFLVLYIGTVSPLRFPAREVIRALGLASTHIPNLALEVFAPVGVQHNYNVAWLDKNVRLAARGAPFPVNVHLQDLTEEQKVVLYNAADLVVLPFRAPVAVEPPLTLLEAMACRAAVAVAPFANRSRIVDEGRNGFTFTSAEDLAASLVTLHGLPKEKRLAIGEEARSTVVCGYSFAAGVRAVESLWASLGSPPHPGDVPVSPGSRAGEIE